VVGDVSASIGACVVANVDASVVGNKVRDSKNARGTASVGAGGNVGSSASVMIVLFVPAWVLPSSSSLWAGDVKFVP
jgi:hypothetical protein